MYLLGRGCTKESRKAFEYFLKSANQGHPKAQFNLGMWHLLFVIFLVEFQFPFFFPLCFFNLFVLIYFFIFEIQDYYI
jgi:hypothetical protein